MFGYVKPDIPNMYIKDSVLYKSLYCGLCKGIGKSCGLNAKMGLSYDVTFLNALFHNIKNIDVKIERQRCGLHLIAKRPMAVVDDLTKTVGCLNTMLTYYKLTDDILDEKKGVLKRSFFNGGYKKAKKAHPQMDSIIKEAMKSLDVLEKQNCDSVDEIAEPFSIMVAKISDYILEDFKTENTYNLCYFLGKWIYLIDALDDYDKDLKKKNYNVFISAYNRESKQKLLSENFNDIQFIFSGIYQGLRENLVNIKFYFNHDLTDNIILKGIPMATSRVICSSMNKSCKKAQKPEKINLNKIN